MKKTLKLTMLSLALLALQGCATHENFVKKYDSWVGHNISELITHIGYPDSTFVLPTKQKVYVYEYSRVYSMPSMMPMGLGYYDGYYGGFTMYTYNTEVIHESCKLFMETNKKGTIVKWGSRGNSCVSH